MGPTRTLGTTLRGLVAGTLLLGSAAVAPAALAQDDSDDRFHAYIYETSCDNLTPDAMLENIGELEPADDDDDNWRFISTDQERPDPLFIEDEDMDDLSLEDLTASQHAIVVHDDEDAESPVLVCGDVQGEPDNAGGILFQLSEQEESGLEGRAWIGYEENDDDDEGDDDLDMVVGVFTAGSLEPLPTPQSSPEATPDS